MAHPTDSRLLEAARVKVVEVAKAHGIEPKQTCAKEGRELRFKAAKAGISAGCAKSSNASAPSSEDCSAKWVAR